jgi:hypothetical protein
VVPSHTVVWTTAPHTRTGIASMGEVIGCRLCCGMTTILNGSTPRRLSPRSAASPGNIATAGCSCSNSPVAGTLAPRVHVAIVTTPTTITNANGQGQDGRGGRAVIVPEHVGRGDVPRCADQCADGYVTERHHPWAGGLNLGQPDLAALDRPLQRADFLLTLTRPTLIGRLRRSKVPQ